MPGSSSQRELILGGHSLRKSVRFEGGVPTQSDFRALQNARLAEEDLL